MLASKFPRMPASLINQTFTAHNYLYAPTFINLHSILPSSYSPLKTSRGLKARIALSLETPAGREVSAEIAYIESWFEGRAMKDELDRRKRQEEEDEEAARQLNFQEHEVNGGLLEWYILRIQEQANNSGCCFDECPLNCMTACAEGHLFCLDCARRNAETTVGNGGHIFKCMDVSGCKAEFPSAEIARFVDAKTIALRDKLASGDAIREVYVSSIPSKSRHLLKDSSPVRFVITVPLLRTRTTKNFVVKTKSARLFPVDYVALNRISLCPAKNTRKNTNSPPNISSKKP